MNVNSILKLNLALKPVTQCQIHTSAVMNKIKAGRYKVTRDRTKPLTYEQAFKPEDIGHKKGFNSVNTGQLEGTFLCKEEHIHSSISTSQPTEVSWDNFHTHRMIAPNLCASS